MDLAAPSLLVHTTGLVRLEAALAPFLLRLASGESTAPGLTADEVHGGHGNHAHGSPGQEARLGMLVGSILKIPANRLPHFLDREGEALLVGYPPSGDRDGWIGGVILPVRHLDELVHSWREHDVVRHLVEEVGEGVYRMDYPRYGPFFVAPAETRGVVVSHQQAMAETLAANTESLWPEAPLAQAHMRAWVAPGVWRPWIAPSPGRRKPRLSAPAFMPPHLQLAGDLLAALGAEGVLDRTRADKAVVDLFFGPVALGVDVRLALTAPAGPADAPPEASSARPATAPGDVRLVDLLPEQAVAYGVLPDAQAVSDLLARLLHHGSDGTGTRALVRDLIVKETLAAMAGEACFAFTRDSGSGLGGLLVFRTATHDKASAYANAIAPHLPSMTRVAAVQDTVVFTGGLKRTALQSAWAEALADGTPAFRTRMRQPDWAQDRDILFLGGVYPVDFLKAYFAEIMVQSQLLGMPIQNTSLRANAFDKVADSPTPGVVAVSRAPGAGGLRLTATIPAGAYMDLARLMQNVVFGWQDIQTQLSEQYLRSTLDAMADAILREQLALPAPAPETESAPKQPLPPGETWAP